MEVRNGHVSNSSSSSFIVAFSRKPRRSDDVYEEMFPTDEAKNRKWMGHPYERDPVDHRSVATAVWRDVRHQEPLTKEELIEFLRECSYQLGADPNLRGLAQEYRSLSDKFFDVFPPGGLTAASEEQIAEWERARDEIMNQMQSIGEKMATIITEEYFSANEGKVYYRLTYSDNDGSFWTFMEHGNIWRYMPDDAVIRVSHH